MEDILLNIIVAYCLVIGILLITLLPMWLIFKFFLKRIIRIIKKEWFKT